MLAAGLFLGISTGVILGSWIVGTEYKPIMKWQEKELAAMEIKLDAARYQRDITLVELRQKMKGLQIENTRCGEIMDSLGLMPSIGEN